MWKTTSRGVEKDPRCSIRAGRILKELRESRGLSVREFGRIVGISGATVSLVERGKRDYMLRVFAQIARKFPEFKIKKFLLLYDAKKRRARNGKRL